MNHKFWHERWEKNNISFHLITPNPLLEKYLSHLELSPGDKIFIPLCGKSLDISWLVSLGFNVVGVELSKIAVEQLFEEMSVTPLIETLSSGILKFSSGPVVIFVGDIFQVSQEMIGNISAVYDRAALVALPEDLRIKYTTHIAQISQMSKILLITFEYDQTRLDGPPFSITREEIYLHYKKEFVIEEIFRGDVPGGLRGNISSEEVVWLIKKSDA